MSSAIRLAGLLLVAAVGAYVLRSVYIVASRPGPAKPPVMERVRVAAADLPQGLLLRDSDLAWKDMPRRQVPPGALVQSANGGDDLKGAVLRNAASAGKALGLADVISPNAPGFLAAALKPGMRAISVAIDDVSGNAGLIQPGDYVDVLLTQRLDDKSSNAVASAKSVEAETVVNRVRVLAVGSAFQRPKAHETEPNTRARTVTFEVTPRTAQVIAVATHLGSLSLALRSFATTDRQPPAAAQEPPPQMPPVWAGDVSRALHEAHADTSPARGNHASGAAHAVIVYRGSKVGDAMSSPAQGNSGGANANAGNVDAGNGSAPREISASRSAPELASRGTAGNMATQH